MRTLLCTFRIRILLLSWLEFSDFAQECFRKKIETDATKEELFDTFES